MLQRHILEYTGQVDEGVNIGLFEVLEGWLGSSCTSKRLLQIGYMGILTALREEVPCLSE